MGEAQTILRGRAIETSVLLDLLETAAKGRLASAVLEGEAGIGKSRLVEELLEAARRQGFRAFYGRAEELAQNRPLGPLLDALGCTTSAVDERRAAIARLVTGEESTPLGIDTDPGLQYRALDAVLELIEEEALASPEALVIEDLQWADPSTLTAMRALMRRLTFLPLVFVVSLRPLPRTRELETLLGGLDREGTQRLSVGPLGTEAVLDLLGDLLDAELGPGLVDGVAGAAGNPLFVIELVRALELEGSIRVSEGRADVEELVLPPSLRLTIVRRIGFLPPGTLEALRACSVLGSPFSVTDLATTTGHAAHEIFRELHPALQSGVLTEEGSLLRFRHDLIRDAVYEDVPESLRLVLHGEAANKLAAAGASAVRVAEQFARSDDPQAMDWLVRAAREAGGGAPSVAADLLERAIALAQPSQIDDLRQEQAASMFWAGRIIDAESVLRSLLDRRPEDGAARGTLGQALMAQGRVQEALREFETAAATATLSPQLEATIRGWTGHARMLLGELDGAWEAATAGRQAADRTGDAENACIALCCLAMVHNFRCELTDAVRLAEEAVALGDRSPGRRAYRFQLGVFQGLLLMDVDRVADGIAALQRGRRISEEIGASWNLPLYQIGLITGHYLSGDWDDALAEFETSASLAEESGTRHGMVCNNAVRALILLHRDELAAATEAVEAAERELEETGPQYRVDWAMWARALLLEATGAVPEAYAVLARAWDVCAGMGLTLELPLLGPDLVRLALAVGERARAENVVSSLEEIAARERAPCVAMTVLRSRAHLEPEGEAWHAAVEAYRQSPRLLDRASVLEDAGTALVGTGRTQEGRALIEEGLGLYDKLAAVRDIARAESKLRELGVRRGRQGARKRPSSGWDSLTDSERRVVPLVAEGLSNRTIADRFFVSPRTIQTHIGHIFAKLGVSSRVELASQAARRAATN